MKIVISQPMFFPWVGLLEQIVLADRFVHYADVQFARRSFTNRVQIKTQHGSLWLTVPLEKSDRSARIDQIQTVHSDWRERHLRTLSQAYAKAPCVREMLALVESVYAQPQPHLGALSLASMQAVCRYFDIALQDKLYDSAELDVGGHKHDRILGLVQHLQGTTYITGQGALNYLAHDEFERHGIAVEYMDYAKLPYPQLHGDFDPFVSSLDLIANHGRAGKQFLRPQTVNWRDMSSRKST
ncbi:WbqC family protein [Burkholderia sp. F1]|uniref:WbqC family protein n=1 Tax=Burkholderia sp. F1 TaxID=3366817 RepID=UPI003D70A3A5